MARPVARKIVDLPDIMTAKDVAAVLQVSIDRAYNAMFEIGDFRSGRSRRIFKSNFLHWLKQNGYKEDGLNELN